jgi:hypothetical protein
MRELRQRVLELALADVAVRANDIGPDLDLHGAKVGQGNGIRISAHILHDIFYVT